MKWRIGLERGAPSRQLAREAIHQQAASALIRGDQTHIVCEATTTAVKKETARQIPFARNLNIHYVGIRRSRKREALRPRGY